jgi:predicted metal-binding protein
MAWSTAEDVNAEVLETINNSMRQAHFTSGIELQREHIDKLAALRYRLKKLRYYSISQSNEPHANAAFRAQMLVSGTKRFLEMWVLLKEDKPTEAWDKLAEAQKDFEIAQRILFDSDSKSLLLHLLAVEKTVFPPQTFLSSAFTYPEAICSICEDCYGDCDHIKGRIYMGRICRRKIPKSNFTEFSIVITPEDKRCRVTEYAENGKVYCTLTRRELPQKEPVDSGAKYVSGCVHHFD